MELKKRNEKHHSTKTNKKPFASPQKIERGYGKEFPEGEKYHERYREVSIYTRWKVAYF